MRLFISTIMLALAMAVSAATYSVADIPNVHVANKQQFIADPDDIISAAAEAQINQALSQLRTATTAEPMAVIVDNINTDDVDDFATELFEAWGLGKSDKDNGLLLLVVKDLHKVVIRTGYGLEGALPDISCGRIIRNIMAPEFRDDNYDAGMVAAITKISEILSNDEYAAEYASKEADADNASSDDGEVLWHAYLVVCIIATLLLAAIVAAKLISLRKKGSYDKYVALAPWRANMLAYSVLFIFMPLIITIPVILLLQHWRNHKRLCPGCGKPMIKVDEVNDNSYLTPSQDLEEQIGSVDYDVWLCPDCGETDILAYIQTSSPMTECPICHARTLALKTDRVIRRPTATSVGLGIKEYECLNCHNHTNRNYEIPRDESAVVGAAAAATILGSGRSRGGFGGGSFGGGFGGGHTGGGGASGGW